MEEDWELGAAEVWVVSLARGSGHGQQVLACGWPWMAFYTQVG